ncbi:MAG: hypothetical protein ACKPJJ_23540 [Planctomycetaceae bacterium]
MSSAMAFVSDWQLPQEPDRGGYVTGSATSVMILPTDNMSVCAKCT